MKVLSEVRDVATGSVVEFGDASSGYLVSQGYGPGYVIVVHSPDPLLVGKRDVDYEDQLPRCDKLGGRPCYFAYPDYWSVTLGVVAAWEARDYGGVHSRLGSILTEFCGVGPEAWP